MIAAEKFELDGLRRQVSERRLLPWALDFAERGRWQGRSVTLVANGPGPVLAAQALETACRHESVDAVISIGFCGGLDPALAVGDMIAATEIRAKQSGKRYPACLPREGSLTKGAIVSDDRVAITVEEKRDLRATGASAVEMEAAGIAERAAFRGIPVYCIRVVSDSSTDAMPLDFNRYRTSTGRFDRGAIFRAALFRPFRHIPALLRLQRQSKLASDKLGEFFAACRL